MARAVLLIRLAMGVPSNRKRKIVGAFIAAMLVWLGACDLNPQPLPPALSDGNGNGSTIVGSGANDDASVGRPSSSSGSSGGSSGSSSGAGSPDADGDAAAPVAGDAAAAESGTDAAIAVSDAGLDGGPEADAMSDAGNTGDASLDAPGD